MTGQEDMVLSCTRRGLGWTLGKKFSQKARWILERAAQGDGGVTIPGEQPGGVQGTTGCGTECFGQGDKVGIGHRLDSMILDIFSNLSNSGTL